MLGKQYKVTETSDRTRDKILLESARLFALEGYHKISMRDIAATVNIKAASIYNHYPGKQDILNDILDKTSDLLDMYHQRLDRANEEIQSLEKTIASTFVEIKNVPTLFTYYGISICIQFQFDNKKCRDLYYITFLEQGKQTLKMIFDRVIEQGKSDPFDTEMLAEVVMNCVNAANNIMIAEKEGLCRSHLVRENLDKLYDYFTKIARAGI